MGNLEEGLLTSQSCTDRHWGNVTWFDNKGYNFLSPSLTFLSLSLSLSNLLSLSHVVK